MLFNSVLPIIITFSGGWLILLIGPTLFFHPTRLLGGMRKALSGREAKRSLALALAGTLGVGNIVGVAVGISIGGAGCVPWLLISSLFSAVLKFSEVSLSAYTCENECGGMMSVIRNSFSKIGNALSCIYATLCLLLAFFMGSALQLSSVIECTKNEFGFSSAILYAFMILCLFFVVCKGVSFIERFTSFAIPIVCVIYICLAFCCIGLNFDNIYSAIVKMIRGAFSLNGVGGGVIGFLSSKVISEGYSRGLLSNEAGAGTSTLAHTRNKEATAVEAGLLGIFEVLFDTVFLCFITALAILVSVDTPEVYDSGVQLVMSCFENSLGEFSRFLVLICIMVFAFSTVVCWYYYGNECYNYMFNTKSRIVYSAMFFISTIMGYYLNVEILVKISDVIFVFLTLITCITVIKNSGKVKTLAGEMLN